MHPSLVTFLREICIPYFPGVPSWIRNGCHSYLEVGHMAATAANAPGDDKVDPKVIKTGLILVVGILAVVFDTTIVSVALHTLVTDLHSSVSTIQWVSTGYLLALGMTVPLSTWGLRRYGGKRLWMVALALFLVGSVGASLAW